MASPKEFPHFVRAMAALGAARVRAVAAEAKVDVGGGDDAVELATRLLARIKVPGDVVRFMNEADEDVIGPVLGVGARGAWRPSLSAEEIAKLPSYRQPSYEGDLWGLFQHRERRPRAELRPKAAVVSFAKAWPELATGAAWRKAKAPVVTRALAAALGVEAAPPTHDGFARVTDAKLGVSYVAVPGGAFAMGISAEEKRALNKRAKALGPDAMEHAKWLAKQASPERTVKVAPFLVAKELLTGAHASRLGHAAKGDPLRVDAEDAAALAKAAGRRLLSEAEWEYLARAGGRSWLSGDEEPAKWIVRADEAAPYGLRGMAWGEWVDDGWHDTYKGAPEDGAAWEPRVRPEIARAGALALYPWQNPGEELLLHVASRDRCTGEAALRLALGVPPRK